MHISKQELQPRDWRASQLQRRQCAGSAVSAWALSAWADGAPSSCARCSSCAPSSSCSSTDAPPAAWRAASCASAGKGGQPEDQKPSKAITNQMVGNNKNGWNWPHPSLSTRAALPLLQTLPHAHGPPITQPARQLLLPPLNCRPLRSCPSRSNATPRQLTSASCSSAMISSVKVRLRCLLVSRPAGGGGRGKGRGAGPGQCV